MAEEGNAVQQPSEAIELHLVELPAVVGRWAYRHHTSVARQRAEQEVGRLAARWRGMCRQSYTAHFQKVRGKSGSFPAAHTRHLLQEQCKWQVWRGSVLKKHFPIVPVASQVNRCQ